MRGHDRDGLSLIVPETDLERRVIHASIERALDREWPVADGTGEAAEVCLISIQADEADAEGWFPVLASLKHPDGGWVVEFLSLRGKVGLDFDGRTVVYSFPAAKGAPYHTEINHGRPDLDKRQFPIDPA